MPDLDFVPLQRTPAPPAPPAAAPRAMALSRLDAPTAPDPAAHAAGWAAGYAAGARRAAQDAAARLDAAHAEQQRAEAARADAHAASLVALDAAAQALRARETPVLAGALQAVHSAALEIAVALLGVELTDASAAARAALARVLTAPDLPDDLVVHLHPRDLAAVPTDVPAGVVLVADPALAPGDAVAEHADGHLDARLSAAVARARGALDLA
ncbi:hypothetical protein J1G44_10225 [Cellulomonas sp. zg-ZUI199]|uniref:Flagellar assembly protein FliH/Type III secretion system HrpE domain-containing protein n=1 Tax=Cellulomonas wangleii TaxID=2816956 RepID=A0ABX8D6E9_9CELL|nr:FliH/SctL family protein [Cellulomonas wangleii]MBO0924858.1 hypothetical protein [Cellulomonas wangleii]QVI63024.1 hypothetical protein KG103_03630 [Cellulomonas wangleii]